jgi:hypothetical protein
MGKVVYKNRDKMKAVLIQSELQSEGIETIVIRDTSPSSPTAFIGLLVGSSFDSGWQIVAHDKDVERAIEFLKNLQDHDVEK